MSKDRRANSDKSSGGPEPRLVMPLKIADKPHPGSKISTESWLASLARLAAQMVEPQPRAQNNRA